MKVTEYAKYDAVALTELLARKEIERHELIELSLSRLQQVNDKINATTYVRKEKALQEIANPSGSMGSSAFNGVPIFLKNISQTIEGEPNTAGAQLLKNETAVQTSNFVRQLYDAGFVSIGNSTAPEFGLKNITEPKLSGPTRNPWNTNYSPGGSSGGATALVAAGVVPVAGASDGGGSIRIPASFTSLVGLKPTRGRTAVGPGAGRNWHGAAIDFVVTKSVRDTARSLDALQTIQPEAAFQVPLYESSYEKLLEKSYKQKLKIGFTTESPVGTPVSDEAKQAVLKTVKWLESEGHHIEEVNHQVDGVEIMRQYYLMNSGEMAALLRHFSTHLNRKIKPEDVEIETWLLARAGESVSAADFTQSIAAWDLAAEKMARFHETYDLFITPATAYPAPKVSELTHEKAQQLKWIDEIERLNATEQQQLIYDMFLPSLTYTPFTQLANLTGQPAISVPVHKTKEGLPLGIQLIAGKGEEHQLLQLAYTLEQSSLWEGMQDTVLTID